MCCATKVGKGEGSLVFVIPKTVIVRSVEIQAPWSLWHKDQVLTWEQTSLLIKIGWLFFIFQACN